MKEHLVDKYFFECKGDADKMGCVYNLVFLFLNAKVS